MKKLLILSIISFTLFTVKVFAVEYQVKDTRDPFASLLPKEAPVAQSNEALPAMTLNGLVWGSEKPQAIINGDVYKIGDEVQGAKIMEITKEGVSLLYQGRIYEINRK